MLNASSLLEWVDTGKSEVVCKRKSNEYQYIREGREEETYLLGIHIFYKQLFFKIVPKSCLLLGENRSESCLRVAYF